jgi:NAD(P)-dependent dehydrogenase (short-subunit alcohol dehydrogenase family)
MDLSGKNALVLGGAGLVGFAVCRELLAQRPALLIVASRQKSRAQEAAEQLREEFPDTPSNVVPVWGDVFIRADWQREDVHPRAAVLADPERRRRLIADVLEPLDEEIIAASMLTRIVEGRAPGLDGASAQILVDCMNTASAVSYQDVYAKARSLAELAERNGPDTDWPAEVEGLLASLYVPQLVRHMQLLYEAMRRAGTEAYVKVGTSGTGGMGLNIPYTHGEEKPSRLLLSKAALAGGQSLLTFLLARTPDAPRIVKEVKPSAVIGWREIDYGPIHRAGRDIPVYDCAPEHAVSIRDPANLVTQGDFGKQTGAALQGVYIHTGENGQFSASEFTAITALGQMELVTPEEIARSVMRELLGANTGHDVVAALDGAVMGPSYRGGYMREAALNRLRQLEGKHGESVAFEILGPPRLSKLLFEAYLLKRACETTEAVLHEAPDALAAALERTVFEDPDLRRRIISVGIPILLSDGERMLRGPVAKAEAAHHGWVDLTAANMAKWQARLETIREVVYGEMDSDTSSRHDRSFADSRAWRAEEGFFDIGEIAAWVFAHEDKGRRGKD